MSTLKQIVLCLFLVLISLDSQAVCKELNIPGFKSAGSKNGIMALINEEKSATLASRCSDPVASAAEMVNEFEKTGPATKIKEGLFYNTISASGVTSRNYLLINSSVYHLSLVINPKNSNVENFHKIIIQELQKDLQGTPTNN
jgi:hypothetical protein